MKSKTKKHPMDPVLVGRRVEAIRITRKMGKGDFAAAIGLDPSSYSKVIKGEKRLLAEIAYEIAEKFQTSMEFLYRNDLSRTDEAESKALTKILTDFDENS